MLAILYFVICLIHKFVCKYVYDFIFMGYCELMYKLYSLCLWWFFFCMFFISRNAQTAYYKVLMANAVTSALRLNQRLPPIRFTREFLSLLLIEDSCQYLFFSLIFLYVSPMILILVPIILFAVLHSASYSLTLLDVSIFLVALKFNNIK